MGRNKELGSSFHIEGWFQVIQIRLSCVVEDIITSGRWSPLGPPLKISFSPLNRVVSLENLLMESVFWLYTHAVQVIFQGDHLITLPRLLPCRTLSGITANWAVFVILDDNYLGTSGFSVYNDFVPDNIHDATETKICFMIKSYCNKRDACTLMSKVMRFVEPCYSF